MSNSYNKLSPSLLKENLMRYHNEQIRERSRDTSRDCTEYQLSPLPITNQQPYSASQVKQGPNHSNNLSISETAKNPNTERNLVEEYRQKLKSKLNES